MDWFVASLVFIAVLYLLSRNRQGHEVSYERGMRNKQPRRPLGCGEGVAICIGAVFLAMALLPDSPKRADRAPAQLSAATIDDCRKLIAMGEREGLIKRRPSQTRIDVEDRIWADLPASSKDGILRAISCDVFGRGSLIDLEGPIVAYGYRSGKRVAMLTSVGVAYE